MRVKQKGSLEYFIGRRYGDFKRLHQKLRTELPGKILPPLPKKNKQSSTTSNLINGVMGRDEDDASSMSSVSTMGTVPVSGVVEQKLGNLKVRDHRRSASALSLGRESPRASTDSLRPKIGSTPGTPKPNGTGDVSTFPHSQDPYHTDSIQPIILWRENQRISLRAFLRTLLSNPQIAKTKAMEEFLTLNPITPKDEDVEDILRRKAMDEKRVEEQKQFYEIARKRAAELDVYMEQ
jgi:hypothetical protein